MNLAGRLEEAFGSNTVASVVLVIIEEKDSLSLVDRLDEVASRELHKNEFKNVTLILRALEQVISKDEDFVNQLIHQGLVRKMLNWFDMVCEHLKVQQKLSKSPIRLVEVFYEVSMRLCQSGSADISKILEVLILRFGTVVIDRDVNFNLRLEAIKTINSMLDSASKETRKKLSMSDHNSLLEDFAKVIVDVGDYEMQVAISEALCRMTPKKLREEMVGKWFGYRSFASTFTTIRVKEFETDCRAFLNNLNSYFGDSRRVFSFPCIRAFLDSTELFKPEDELLQKFWVDFNIGTSCIGFYVNDPQETLWELIHLPKEALGEYSLRECSDEKILSIHMLLPVTHGNMTGKMVQITFDSEHDIETAVERVFGEQENLQLQEAPEHPTVLEDDSGIPATPDDLQTSISPPVTETTGKPQASSVLKSGPGRIPSLRGKRFQVEDSFSLTNDSDTEVTVSETLITEVSGRSHVRKRETITFMAALWKYQVARAKAVIFGQSHSSNGSVSSIKSLPASGGQAKLKQKGKRRLFHSKSDSSEPCLSRGKPQFDYTRKKPQMKTKLKVLPLSPTGNEENDIRESTPKHGLERKRREGVDERCTLELSHPSKELIEDSSFQDMADLEDSNVSVEDTLDYKPPLLPQKRPLTSTDWEGHELSMQLEGETSSFSALKPRKLFASISTTETSHAVMVSEHPEAEMSSGVMGAFNSFQAQLKEHFCSWHKNTEEKSLRSLTDCQQTVASLLRTVHDQRLIHLEQFQDAVVQQMGQLEQNCLSLKNIEQETVGFWQSVSDTVRDFCNKQQKRLDSLDAQKCEQAIQSQAEGTEVTTGMISDVHNTTSTLVPDGENIEEIQGELNITQTTSSS